MSFAVAFDFSQKIECALDIADVSTARHEGRYCWIDFEAAPSEQIRQTLHQLDLDELTIDTILDEDESPRFSVLPACLLFTLPDGELIDGELSITPVRVVLGGGFLVTIHQRPSAFLKEVERTYHEDFREHARSEGFLLFEFADHLTQTYRLTLEAFSELVESVERRLFGDVEDEIFGEVSELIRSLLEFRKLIVAARETVHELATRRSPFISTTTQPFLEKKANVLERLGADVTTEREVLSECLSLYMGIVSYRTNRILNRLTMLSTIFLPLGFLAGVYGMNFGSSETTIPELRWRFGYGAFWMVALTLVGSLLFLMKRKRWL